MKNTPSATISPVWGRTGFNPPLKTRRSALAVRVQPPGSVKIRLAGRKGFFFCDQEDAGRVADFRWQLGEFGGRPRIYTRTCGRKIYLARFILLVDGNHLNVTKKNLATKLEVTNA